MRNGQKRTNRMQNCFHIALEHLEPRSMMAAQPLTSLPLDPQSLDGTGNNVAHPDWGSTVEDLLRRSPVAYGDSISTPSGADRPNARAISNALATSPDGGITNNRDFTAFVYAWGQFLDHDLSLTETGSPRESFSIAVPAGDTLFDPASTGTKTISMSRSAFDPATGAAIGNPRQQVNSLTAFIDGSQIYGVDADRAAALREFSGGRLKTSQGNLLPFNTAGFANANEAHRVADSQLFLAGDVRANENPELIAMQTLFLREHNRLAAAAAAGNPSWTDEQLFQHARRMVIAELQDITFNEFLPAILGDRSPASLALAGYKGYQADVNPGIATEFSTAAYRLGHSMLGEDIEFLDNNGNEVHAAMALRDAFFNPTVVGETGIDPILKYLASDRAQEVDTKVVDDVRNFLFGEPGQGGFDLASLNIQRGRDHGIADYNSVRVAYGLPRVTSFAQITGDKAVQDALAAAYGSGPEAMNKLDLWVAGLAEKHLPRSSLGETFTRIVVDQFSRLRDGDRYWYQNVLPADAVREIQKTSLADIIRRNTQLTNMQSNVFYFRTSIGGNVFADRNRDGQRQQKEMGLAGTIVTLVDATGATVATSKSNARGDYIFAGIDLGSFRVVVSPPGGGTAVTSRTVAITRGMEIRNNDIALAPPASVSPPAQIAPPAKRPQPAPQSAPRPAPQLAPRSMPGVRNAAFAAIGTLAVPGAPKR